MTKEMEMERTNGPMVIDMKVSIKYFIISDDNSSKIKSIFKFNKGNWKDGLKNG